MALSGPKPKPSRLKLIEGNAAKVRQADLARKVAREPQVAPEVPEPPADLTEVAKAEWRRISAELHAAGLLTRLDVGALATCCEAWARWREAESILAAIRAKDPIFRGLIIKTTNGNMIQNPLIGTSNKSMDIYLKACAEFGLTPSSRSRIDVEPPEEKDPAADFFAA